MTTMPPIAAIKAGMRATWMSGDFGQIARYEAGSGEELLGRLGVAAHERVLDVACGTGNIALAAARLGASATGLDFAPNLLAQARDRALAAGLTIQFDEGDAEALPYPAGAFDLVASAFGVMFAPQPERAAAELVRVCRPGGRIALLSWTPRGLIGQLFLLVCRYAPLPPNLPPPVLWGVDGSARAYLGAGVADFRATVRTLTLVFPFGPREVADLYIAHLGVIQRAYANLDAARQAALRHDLEQFFGENNRADDGMTRLDGEFLEVTATRA
ncbi:MAG TPA: methyltransferase domain-containing protein [Thermomicrobiales bacterium]